MLTLLDPTDSEFQGPDSLSLLSQHRSVATASLRGSFNLKRTKEGRNSNIAEERKKPSFVSADALEIEAVDKRVVSPTLREL